MPRSKRTAKILRAEAREKGPRTILPRQAEEFVESNAQLQHYRKLADIALKTPCTDKVR